MSDPSMPAAPAPSVDLRVLLSSHLNRFLTLPFLFVGSGLSRRYLGLETWATLLSRFAAPTGKPFGYFLSKADANLPRAAAILAADYLEVWWKDEEFRQSRQAITEKDSKADFPLKYEISKYLKEKSKALHAPGYTEEIEMLKAANIDGVITTNWDLLLENLFPEFQVFKGQEELLFSTPQSIAEIYKIHGCCSLPNSLVLTEADYKDFNERNPYLAAKLLTIFLEHPVIFLGYSLADENIVNTLTAIAGCMRTENLEKLQDHLIVVEWQPKGEPLFSSTQLAINQKVVPVTLIKTDSFTPIFRALTGNRQRFPAKLLRRLKSHIYELVKTHDSAGQMYVRDLDKESEDSPIQVVYGVGVMSGGNAIQNSTVAGFGTPTDRQQIPLEFSQHTPKMSDTGYGRIPKEKLLHDIVFDDGDFDPEKILRYTLPDLLTHPRHVPVFKYLRMAGYFGGKDLSDLSKKVKKAMGATYASFGTTNKANATKRERINSFAAKVADITNENDPEKSAELLLLLDENCILTDDLHRFLVEHYDRLASTKKDAPHLNLKKLVCLYDMFKWGRNAR